MNNKNKTKISFVSLGCSKNLVDTEVVGGMLEKHKLQLVSEYEDTDWLVINTCGFIRDAKEESIDEILAALEKKECGEIKHVAIFGCLTQRYQEELRENFKEADIVWGVNDLEELARLIAETDSAAAKDNTGNNGKLPIYRDSDLFLYDENHTRITTTTPNVTFIKISEGCNMKCSFCAIPQIRGPFRSRTIDSIVKEAEKFKAKGVQEINLVSQNSTYFGKDRGKRSELPDLLKALSQLRFKGVRLLYLMPEEVTDDIIDAFAYPSIIPYFDLPFQHVSPELLKAMNRSGTVQQKAETIAKIRNKYKDAVIRSSFIVGFPGETNDHFNQLADFARDMGIERLGVFKYSDEENTEAFDLGEKVEPYVIEDRYEQMMDISDENIAKYNQRLMDQEAVVEFLPLGPWDNNCTIGRIKSQAPDTDGLTRVDLPFNNEYTSFPIRIVGFDHELLIGEVL